MPFYLFKSATRSPSPSIKSAVRNCREQHSSLSPKSPFSSTLLLTCSQAVAQLSWAQTMSCGFTGMGYVGITEKLRHWHAALFQFLESDKIADGCQRQTTTQSLSFVLWGKSRLPHSNSDVAPFSQQMEKPHIFMQESRVALSLRSHAQVSDVKVVPDKEMPVFCDTELKKEWSTIYPTFLDGPVKQLHNICSLHSTCFEALRPGYQNTLIKQDSNIQQDATIRHKSIYIFFFLKKQDFILQMHLRSLFLYDLTTQPATTGGLWFSLQ